MNNNLAIYHEIIRISWLFTLQSPILRRANMFTEDMANTILIPPRPPRLYRFRCPQIQRIPNRPRVSKVLTQNAEMLDWKTAVIWVGRLYVFLRRYLPLKPLWDLLHIYVFHSIGPERNVA